MRKKERKGKKRRRKEKNKQIKTSVKYLLPVAFTL